MNDGHIQGQIQITSAVFFINFLLFPLSWTDAARGISTVALWLLCQLPSADAWHQRLTLTPPMRKERALAALPDSPSSCSELDRVWTQRMCGSQIQIVTITKQVYYSQIYHCWEAILLLDGHYLAQFRSKSN